MWQTISVQLTISELDISRKLPNIASLKTLFISENRICIKHTDLQQDLLAEQDLDLDKGL